MTIMEQSFQLNENAAIPAVGFGTYLISNEDASIAVCTAIQNGYRHIDTASGYQNEKTVGEGIEKGMAVTGLGRDEVFVTGKLWPGNPAWGDPPKSKEQTIEACHASLERLGLEFFDLYLIHAPYGGSERINQWRALVELSRLGKARAIGVSNYTQAHLEEIKESGLPMPDANQIELHPWSQKPELVEYMLDNDITPIAYSSLAPLSTWRVEEGQDSAKTQGMIDDSADEGSPFKMMAQKYNVTEAQLLLRWGVQSGYAVLPKSLNVERMRQNIDLASFEIDDGDMAMIKTMDRGEAIAWASGDPSDVA